MTRVALSIAGCIGCAWVVALVASNWLPVRVRPMVRSKIGAGIALVLILVGYVSCLG